VLLHCHPRSLLLVALLTLAACAPPPASTPAPAAAPPERSAPPIGAAPKRVNVIVFREMDFLPNNSFPGSPDVRHLVNPGLTVLDDQGKQQPLLVEAVPSLENGLWKLLPDGRMETTWRVKSGVRWHDGELLTADDLVFTTQLGQDRSTGAFGHTAYNSVESVSAPDPQTVVVTWKQPYVDADQMFTVAFGYPLPRHLL
jgi:ABC-type transport system substrate-binding protein